MAGKEKKTKTKNRNTLIRHTVLILGKVVTKFGGY